MRLRIGATYELYYEWKCTHKKCGQTGSVTEEFVGRKGEPELYHVCPYCGYVIKITCKEVAEVTEIEGGEDAQ